MGAKRADLRRSVEAPTCQTRRRLGLFTGFCSSLAFSSGEAQDPTTLRRNRTRLAILGGSSYYPQ